MTCSVLSPMRTTISWKHILILIFYYPVGRTVSPKFLLALSAANDGILSKFKSHYSGMLLIFPQYFFTFLFLYWKITVFDCIVKKPIRNVLLFLWFEASVIPNKNTCLQPNLCFLNWREVIICNTYHFCPNKTCHCSYRSGLASNITCHYNQIFNITTLMSLYFN